MFKMFGKTATSNTPTHIIVGLGNIGKKYENTRHNAGFIAIDTIAKELCVKIDKLKYNALITTCKIGENTVLLMKPQTFMNNSGQAVTQAMSFYKIPPENVIILFDDINLDVGKMRIRLKGSDGGQNGMKSIINLSGKNTFPRIKIGIGKKPHEKWELADWVLSTFTTKEIEEMEKTALNVFEATKLLVENNSTKAMNLYNS